MKRAAIYARVSTDKQEEEKTISSQVAELRRICGAEGCQVVQEYLDEGVSGATLARPGLDQLRDDASRGLFDAVYILSPDRLARKYLYQVVVLEELKKKGIQVVFLNRPVTDTPEDQLLFGIQGVIAEYERALIIERVRRGKIHAARNGRIQTSTPKYGYRLVLKTKEIPAHYEINQKEARVVQLIFSRYVKLRSSTKAAEELYRLGIPSPKGFKYWRPCVVNRMLRFQDYIGTAHYNKTNGKGAMRPRSEWVPIKIPAIIDEQTFRMAQRILDEHNGGKRLREYLLTGFVKCRSCGHSFIGCAGYTRKDGSRHSYYRCTGSRAYSPIPRICSTKMVNAEALEGAIVNQLSHALLTPVVLMRHVTNVACKAKGRAEQGKTATKNLVLERRTLEDKRRRLLDLYVEGMLPKGEYANRVQTIDQRIEELEKEIQESTRRVPELSLEDVKRAARRLLSMAKGRLVNLPLGDLRHFLRLLIDEVIYDEEKCEARIIGHLPMGNGHSDSLSPFTGGEVPEKWDNNRSLRFELEAKV